MIRVGIVDDHAIVRAALKGFLGAEVDLRVVGEGASGRDAVDLAKRVSMDVMLLDLSMPGQQGTEAISTIRIKASSLSILVLSGYPAEQYAAEVLRLGANCYLSKDCEPSLILDAIRAISNGGRFITSAVAELLVDKTFAPPHERLSAREMEVFRRLSVGNSPSEIAVLLNIHVKTVSTYRARLLKVSSR